MFKHLINKKREVKLRRDLRKTPEIRDLATEWWCVSKRLLIMPGLKIVEILKGIRQGGNIQ